ncbi:hypothetical protein A3H10_00015 [Candidatus Uhrbacteria bacterium RIFCSPLOWO2_12_FULL_46_10]|uniref:Uncharacterized protein n=1 Tax=Candidatus Uhrbacteria bacterium RIFCSPLOWO2_01_FULL_47_25 TaxID=1802402 RepID=A0A1F7UTA8_9BACT|nr:MAG: hypothetical protein A3D60_01245 [Candidatus Uhrbacteria bacterium RIFCSPHIGHO2_02_FULL_47_29]OGL75509.1 MAG: hypothetical protein A3E96_03570 [Candidatus Uhrbacteria bacterium RIFCSPHIGHO2_12_FULL_46_13]OGL81540.1 MAG: hypothetical protein A2936_01725 [Candidatus Uhrbacteria bacterium RIFCSPLOWO2_01_FULL_47_25]OGL85761.1 MAG: hypothetical protein A3I37_02665 [Candidatus Uhrbacteria bacterium RIFCSPLOWO2_02_FULL_46_19]OGL90690.1 MAG: hypothetical protein A3H10_00015 [Candidatus Uhrbacte
MNENHFPVRSRHREAFNEARDHSDDPETKQIEYAVEYTYKASLNSVDSGEHGFSFFKGLF